VVGVIRWLKCCPARRLGHSGAADNPPRRRQQPAGRSAHAPRRPVMEVVHPQMLQRGTAGKRKPRRRLEVTCGVVCSKVCRRYPNDDRGAMHPGRRGAQERGRQLRRGLPVMIICRYGKEAINCRWRLRSGSGSRPQRAALATLAMLERTIAAFRTGPGYLNNFSASISGASAGVRPPCGGAAG